MNLAYSSIKICPADGNQIHPGDRGNTRDGRGPDQAAIGVDVDLGHAELGGGEIFVLIHAAAVDQACRRPC